MSRTRSISALAAGLAILVAACWFVTGTFPLAAAPQVVNDAAGVTVDLGGAAVLHRTGVPYPEAAWSQRVQGTVVVEVKLDSKGGVSDARVVTGPDELRNGALQSVLQWHFAKAQAMSSRQVSIAFRLPAPVAAEQPAAPAEPRAPVAEAARKEALPQPTAGRTLKGINVYGLSDQSRADLLGQIPAHEGDAFSLEMFQNVARVVKGFDEHLSISIKSAAGGATLEITAPGGVGTPGGTIPEASAGTKRIMVGGSVQQRMLVSPVRPKYPPEAKAAHITGVVKLSALIGKDGSIQNLEVISGEPVLVQSALESVKQWVYQPTLLNGEPVEVITQIDVNYTLSQ